jgi:hypoxanthine phosphoribosyltransferase
MKTMFTAEQIATRVAELGAEIRGTYGDDTITAVCVLKGSFVFMPDLVRAIEGDVRIEFLGVSSYAGTHSTGTVRITQDLKSNVEGKHVLIVEDIVDTGLTLDYLKRVLQQRAPASLRVAALLDKPSRRKVDVDVDFIGMSIPDEFVVGYGLDLDERFRNVPFVAIYEGEGDG